MNKDKRTMSYSPKKQKTDSEVQILSFRERMCAFSLGFRPFGPSVLEEARSKVVLCGEGYAWTPIWWSSDNSKMYGSFPTCVNLYLRAM